MVEIFETVEGEGTRAGYPTVFVRVFHCNLRCTWCDTPYSYAPAKPEFEATIGEIAARASDFGWENVCLTGGEPLIHRHKSQLLIEALAAIDHIQDIHIETNGAIDVRPFAVLREKSELLQRKVRFIVDYKLPDSGEMDKMVHEHLNVLQGRDELKFVIANDDDFDIAVAVISQYDPKCTILFSPVWETMPPERLVEKILRSGLKRVKLNLQIHKVIWDPAARGV
ncbi:radical SAM protein [Alicyclobacillus fastidiosus]|uniref:7-carboxy-7-deazaguanine synthase n=1 Tax=Alicyclobacillus fastidiosus TaxID=392011 RepID=A0ABY6ZP08_9BACL|nr:radical SAM protein [Alicyclobacillus fastidiosus]WAH44582.1 radical SAM protein [Alicyclobacillus fastidiosus]GMA60133.1 7-carboxy-7-deazaguanine synthase [Alicyclobacillus fastidiosus]